MLSIEGKDCKILIIGKKEEKYLDQLLFEEILHLEQTKADSSIPEGLLKKLKKIGVLRIDSKIKGSSQVKSR